MSGNASDSNGSKKKILIAVTVAILFSSLVVAFVLLQIQKKSQKSDTPGESGLYYDPGSGETVSDPPDKTPETYGSQGRELTYLGFSKLLEFGVSKFQLDATKLAFENYSKSRDNNIKEVSITSSSIKNGPDKDDFTLSVEFEFVINRKEHYQAELQLHMIRQVKLILKNGEAKIYESKLLEPPYSEGGFE